MPISVSLCTNFEPKVSCAKWCWPWRRKRRVKAKATLAGERAIIVMSAKDVVVGGMLEGVTPQECDFYVFDTDMVYLSCQGPSLQQWSGEDTRPEEMVGKCLFDVYPETANVYLPVFQRTLAGESVMFMAMWSHCVSLVTTYPLVGRVGKGRKKQVVGGMLVSQPCGGLNFNVAAVASASTDSE